MLHCLQANDFAGHNSSLFVLGVMILWFGWCVPSPAPARQVCMLSCNESSAPPFYAPKASLLAAGHHGKRMCSMQPGCLRSLLLLLWKPPAGSQGLSYATHVRSV